ncbi:hypothetical protein BH11GEM2_BH11GEM2_31940 [soil metagenome]|jgi:hypothetical protein
MTTRLTEPLRREIEIDGEAYTVLITASGVRLARKRFREGTFVSWKAMRDMELPEAPDI